MKTVSVVVPAFNEEGTIRQIAKTLQKSKKIGICQEAIVVNDGSTDQTGLILDRFKDIKQIRLPRNKGKGNAIAQGIKASKSDIIVLLDADFTNLKTKYIKLLLSPIISGEYQASVGVPDNNTLGIAILPKEFSGQRAYYRKDLMPILGEIGKAGYGIEVLLNSKHSHLKTNYMKLKGLKYTAKISKKQHKLLPIYNFTRMCTEIVIQSVKNLFA
ncbi:glycosyltransferase family 2 protein [Candidatus Dojkabacteria bacterium]|nr:glycosyltransferase family 2 protein [Candidatus Dojkabacteria bacterium]